MYLPTASLSPLYIFVQKTSTSAALQSALITAFPSVASIQCFDDAANAGSSLVVVNDVQVMTIPSTNWLGYNQGTWTQYTNAKFITLYTVYP